MRNGRFRKSIRSRGGSVKIEVIGGRLAELIGLLAASGRKAVVVSDQGEMVGIVEAVTGKQLQERAMADPEVQADLARTEQDLANGRTISAIDLFAGNVQWPDGVYDE